MPLEKSVSQVASKIFQWNDFNCIILHYPKFAFLFIDLKIYIDQLSKVILLSKWRFSKLSIYMPLKVHQFEYFQLNIELIKVIHQYFIMINDFLGIFLVTTFSSIVTTFSSIVTTFSSKCKKSPIWPESLMKMGNSTKI